MFKSFAQFLNNPQFLFSIHRVVFPCTVQCTNNEFCKEDEACIQSVCRSPCDVHNPCVPNAVCVNKNHGSECLCREGYAGNGLISCQPGKLN
jgi:hypothetical protein